MIYKNFYFLQVMVQ